MEHLAKKSNLARHLSRLRKNFPEAYNFFPSTWLYPTEAYSLKKEMLVRFFIFEENYILFRGKELFVRI